MNDHPYYKDCSSYENNLLCTHEWGINNNKSGSTKVFE